MSEPMQNLVHTRVEDTTHAVEPEPEPDVEQQVGATAALPLTGLATAARERPDRATLKAQSARRGELHKLRNLGQLSQVTASKQGGAAAHLAQKHQLGPDYDPMAPVVAARRLREAKEKLDALQPKLAVEIAAARDAGGTDPDLVEFDSRSQTESWIEALVALEGIQHRSTSALAAARASLTNLNAGLKTLDKAASCHQPPGLAASKKTAWQDLQAKKWVTVGAEVAVIQRQVTQGTGFTNRLDAVEHRIAALKNPARIQAMSKFVAAHRAMDWQAVVATEHDKSREGSLAHLEDEIERSEKPFGDRLQAQGAAQQISSEIAEKEHDAQVAEAQEKHDADVTAVPEVKVKVKKKSGKGPSGPTKKEQTALDERQGKLDGLDTQLSTAKVTAQSDRGKREQRLYAGFESVANSASGRAIDDGTLTWLINAAGAKPVVAQSLADVAAAGGIALAKNVSAQPNVSTVARDCVDLLNAKFPAEHAVRAALLAGKSKAVVQPWLLALDPAAVPNALDFADAHANALRYVVKVQPALGTGGRADDMVDALAKMKTSDPDVDWLLGLSANPGGPDFAKLCSTIRNYEVRVPDVRAFHQAAGTNFSFGEIVSMVQSHHTRLTQATAVVAGADSHCVSYVDLVVAVGSTVPAMLKLALRAESLLRDAAVCPPGFAAATSRADRPYTGAPNFAQQNYQNGARTGFIRLTFPGGATAEVHTHWNSQNKSVGKISSMHVQETTADGSAKNGVELDDWPQYFKELPQAVVDAHNVATGNRAPTGGSLSMP
jgi:hypothetical protein